MRNETKVSDDWVLPLPHSSSFCLDQGLAEKMSKGHSWNRKERRGGRGEGAEIECHSKRKKGNIRTRKERGSEMQSGSAIF